MILEQDSSTASFFIGLSGIAFGVSGFAGALELIRQLIGKPQELRYLSSILWIAGLVIVFALLPLVLIGVPDASKIGCWSFFVACAALFLYITWEVVSRRVGIQYPVVFALVYITTLGWLPVLYFNASVWQSIIVYKLCLLWVLFLLILRFTLFIRHISKISETALN